jgi:hypothetical protein
MSINTRVTALALTSAMLAGVTVGKAFDSEIRCAPVIVLNDNGAWSWFEDERAVVDVATGTLLVSSVADRSGTDGARRDGNVEVVAYDIASRTSRRFVLHRQLEADDHNSAALHVRPDGRYVAAYSRHTTDQLTRWRVSVGAGPELAWAAESTFDHGAPTTYSNLVSPNENRLLLFVRTAGRDPHYLVSEDAGSSWRHGGRLLAGPGRPYVRYAADASGRIHIFATEQHPADFGNSVYHGIVDDGRLLSSSGAPIDTRLTDRYPVPPTRLTKVFAGDGRRRAWTIDVQVDQSGLPYAAFSVQTPDARLYYYARFDGTQWHAHEMADAGSSLYEAEAAYTGLVALDPHDPSRVVISTDVDPTDGSPAVSRSDGRRHHELFEGRTVDGGVTWSWTPITSDSTVDNIRPIIPVWDESHTALLWLRGTYTTYQDFDLDVVALVGATEVCEQASLGLETVGGDRAERDHPIGVCPAVTGACSGPRQ